MRSSFISALASLAVAFVVLSGCSGDSRYSKFGYSTAEKDGRLYVFPLNSAEYQNFTKTGEMGKSVTRIGAGPNGMTIIGPDASVIDSYLGK